MLRSSPNLQKEIPARCNCGCGIAPIVILFLSFHKLLFRSNIFCQKCLVCTAPGFTQSFWIGVAELEEKPNLLHLGSDLSTNIYVLVLATAKNDSTPPPQPSQIQMRISARIISLPTAPKLINWCCLVMPYFPALHFPLGGDGGSGVVWGHRGARFESAELQVTRCSGAARVYLLYLEYTSTQQYTCYTWYTC